MRIKNICMVGMGYVGLTLSVVLADRGFEVYGVEVDKSVVKQLNQGKPHFHEKGLDALLKKHLNKNLFVTEKIPEQQQDVFIISVGTPINKDNKRPILNHVINAVTDVSNYLKDGNLIVLRSTVPVGTTRNVVKPIFDKVNKKYFLAFCPERTAEGKALIELKELPQVIGGLDEESADKAEELFRKVTPTTIEVSSLESAEMVKLLNNSYRDLTFAYSNEVAMICEKAGLDVIEVIKAANLGYFRSDIPLPGFVGGACLEKDPHILIDFSNRKGYFPKLIKQARDLNEHLPLHVAEKIKSKLETIKKNIKDCKIFVMGFGFKGQPETDDIRGSLTIDLVENLKKYGCRSIYGHDFAVGNKKIEEIGVKTCSLEDGFKNADCVIFANNHQSYYGLNIEHLISLMNKPAVFFDVWYIFDPKEIIRADIIYGGVGFD